MTEIDDLRIDAETAEKSALRMAQQLCDKLLEEDADPVLRAVLAVTLNEQLKLARSLRRALIVEVAG